MTLRRVGKYGFGLFFAILLLSSLPMTAGASESGGSQVNNGAAGFYSGLMPRPGNYFENFTVFYHAGRFNDDHGGKSASWDHVTFAANALRYTHVTDITILGGTWGASITMPFAWGEAEVNGRRQSKTGQGDLLLDPFQIGWHGKTIHVMAGLNVAVPTGAYDKRDIANIGRNHFGVRPTIAVTYLNEAGIELSVRSLYAFNTENHATSYRTGQEFQTDCLAALHVDDWAFGVGGYVYRQTTDDVVNGAVAPHRKGRVFALGPQVRYVYHRVGIAASWNHEMAVRNRLVGDAAWLKLGFRF